MMQAETHVLTNFEWVFGGACLTVMAATVAFFVRREFSARDKFSQDVIERMDEMEKRLNDSEKRFYGALEKLAEQVSSTSRVIEQSVNALMVATSKFESMSLERMDRHASEIGNIRSNVANETKRLHDEIIRHIDGCPARSVLGLPIQ